MVPFPEQASTVAPTVDLILLVLTLLGCTFSGIVATFIVAFAIYYRQGSRASRKNAPTENLLLELTWAGVPLALGLAVFAWAAVTFLNYTNPPDIALNIYVVGRQWMWTAQHPTGQRENNTLHIPVDTPINLIMISEDVIHSFWVPAFRVKQDVLPGRFTQMWFEPTLTGTYPLHCTEYCGTLHSQMEGTVYVMEQSDYQQWLEGTGDAVPLQEQSALLFESLGCRSCHMPDAGRARGPSLVGLFGSEVELQTGEVVTADYDYIRRSIIAPSEQIVAGFEDIMPSYAGQLTEEQIVALVEYIRTLDTIESERG